MTPSRPPLTVREAQVLSVWRAHWHEHHSTPSYKALAAAVNAAVGTSSMTHAGIATHLARLKRKGYLQRGRRLRSWREGGLSDLTDAELLQGTTRGGLFLTVELTGPRPRVIEEAEAAISHLQRLVTHLRTG